MGEAARPRKRLVGEVSADHRRRSQGTDVCAGTSPRALVAVVQPAADGLAVELGGGLLAHGQVVENEAVAAEQQSPDDEGEEAVGGHGRGGQRTSGSGSQAGCGVFSRQVPRFAFRLTGGDQSSVTFEPAPRAADGGSNLGWVQGGPLVRRFRTESEFERSRFVVNQHITMVGLLMRRRIRR